MTTLRIDQTKKFWWLSWKWILIAMEKFCILLWFFNPEKLKWKVLSLKLSALWHILMRCCWHFSSNFGLCLGENQHTEREHKRWQSSGKQWKFIQSNLLSRTPPSNCFRLVHQIARKWHKFHRFNLLKTFVATSRMFKTSSRPWNVVTIYQFLKARKVNETFAESKSKLSSILSGLRTSNKLWTLEKRTRRKKKFAVVGISCTALWVHKFRMNLKFPTNYVEIVQAKERCSSISVIKIEIMNRKSKKSRCCQQPRRKKAHEFVTSSSLWWSNKKHFNKLRLPADDKMCLRFYNEHRRRRFE